MKKRRKMRKKGGKKKKQKKKKKTCVVKRVNKANSRRDMRVNQLGKKLLMTSPTESTMSTKC
jgi:hypothetical protein